MLHLILGRSGYGKSQKILSNIGRIVENDGKPLVIVPDQFSFEMERRLYFKLGAKKSIDTEVLGFSRLAYSVFRQYGGTAGRYISDGGKNLLVHLAISEVIDNLSLYKDSALGHSFIKDITKTISQLKQSSVSPQELRGAVQSVFLESIKQKGEEISLIYEAYNTLLEKGYDDTDDNLTKALELIRKNNFFSGKTVLIDEFKGFTADELLIIEEMVKQCKDIYVALNTDEIYDTEDGIGLFSYVKLTSTKLASMAKKNHIPIAVPIQLEKPQRYKVPELAHLEKNLFSIKARESKGEYFDNSSIKIFQADNVYSELEFVSAKIKELVGKNKLRYKDFAILGREISTYENAISTMMGRYDIPYFYSMTENVYSKPYLMYISSVLGAIVNNYNNDSLFSLMKTGLLGLSIEQISELENYVYTWDIRKAEWEEEFFQSPKGFVSKKKEEDEAALVRINETRKLVIDPIKKFKEDTNENITGLEFARMLYELIEEMNVDKNYAKIIKDSKSDISSAEHKQIWEMFSKTLDEYADLLKTTRLSIKKHYELITIMIESIKVGEIPQNIDEVLIGDASLTRPNNPKITFVIGANEGLFPKTPEDIGIFTSDERELLIEKNINLSDNLEKKAIDERFILYKALTSPSIGLFISYPIYNPKGEPAYPSAFIKELLRISGGIEKINRQDFIKNHAVQNSLSALYTLGRNYREESIEKNTIKSILKEKEKYEENLNRLEEILINKNLSIGDTKHTKNLYGNFLRLSPTKVERFMGCKFSYFSKYGLKLEKREKAQLSPLEIGTLVHHALQILLEKHQENIVEIKAEVIDREIEEILSNYIEKYMGGVEDKTKRFKYLYSRLKETIKKLIDQLAKEFSQSLFKPTDFELVVGKEGVKPIKLNLDTGESIVVEGIIDRVDIMERDGEKYVRVVDYKTGSKDFKLSDVYYGLNMQMLIYLFSIWENGEGRYQGSIPAGVLYMPAKTTAIDTDRDTKKSEMELLKTKTYRMQGLVLNNSEVIKGMDRNGAGVFINVSLLKSDAPKKGSAVATLEELGELKKYIETLIRQMAKEIYRGEIDAFPIRDGQRTSCDWCPYNSICGHEEGDRYKEIKTLKTNEVFMKIREEDRNGMD